MDYTENSENKENKPGPPLGSKNAEKWDLQTTYIFMDRAYQILKKNDKIYFIGSLAVEMDTYRTIFPYLVKKHGDNPVIFNTYNKMLTLLEARSVEKGMDGTNYGALTMMHLKVNHGWDRDAESDDTGEDLMELPEEELDNLIKELTD